MVNIAIFASGSGTNAENLIRHFESHPNIRVVLVVTNKREAGVARRANKLGVPVVFFPKADFIVSTPILDKLKEYEISFIILAGFLLKIPNWLILDYPSKILNLHPALLPKFGGKGMYGTHVHQAVIESGESVSGITIHEVNQNYDEGKIIFQASCPVHKEDTPGSLAARVHELEYAYYPGVAENYITQKLKI